VKGRCLISREFVVFSDFLVGLQCWHLPGASSRWCPRRADGVADAALHIPKKPVRSTNRNAPSRRSRIPSRGAPMAADLDARCRDLEARLQASQEKNESLTEQAKDNLLLGLVSDAIGRHEDSAAILATVLEEVAVVKDISYCAFVEPENTNLVISHEYAAFAEGERTGAVLHASADGFAELVGGEPEPREWFLPRMRCRSLAAAWCRQV